MLYLSNTILHLLVDKKKNKKEVAEKSGLLPASFSRMVNKADNDYHISTLCAIMQALNCSMEIVIKDSESGQTLYTIKED